MCGRYVLKEPLDVLQRMFRYSSSEIRQLRPRYNIAPTTKIPVIRCNKEGIRELAEMRWGLVPVWAKDIKKLPLMNNARSESVATKPSFRAAFKARRCLIPASGYYEWQKRPGGLKQPFFIHHKDGTPMAFAGLWEASFPDDKECLLSATIVTTAASPKLAPIHDRMVVVLNVKDRELWMSQDPLTEKDTGRLFASKNDPAIATTPVSTLVNNVRNDDPKLLDMVKV
jgi:putative SOS response-associated peptidase YedK